MAIIITRDTVRVFIDSVSNKSSSHRVAELFSLASVRACSIWMGLYSLIVTQAVAHILDEFEHLSDTERRELRHAIVERIPMSEDLTDGDFAALAAASFQALDREEDAERA